MSIFKFLADVGEKILGYHDTAAANTNQPASDATLGQQLQQKIEQLALGIANPKVTVQDGKATLEGNATSQEALEKAVLAIGNTLGISQVDAQIAAPQQNNAPQSKFYTVKSGDTLSKISKECYGDANRYNEIFKANQPLLTSVDKIYPGQQLRIPQTESKAA